MSASELIASLPSRSDAFTSDAPRLQPPPKRYLPGASDLCKVPLQSTKTRQLVRVLRASGGPPTTTPVGAPPAPPVQAMPAGRAQAQTTSRKRAREHSLLRLDDLPKRSRQACLRVALSAACAVPDPPQPLVNIRSSWQANPRARFRLTRDIRALLAASVPRWTTATLTRYMERANPEYIAMPRAELVSAIRFHLSPPIVYHA